MAKIEWLAAPSGMYSSREHLPLFIKDGEVPTNFLASFCRRRGRKAEGLERERVEMNLFRNFASTKKAVKYVQDNFRWSLRDPSALVPGRFL